MNFLFSLSIKFLYKVVNFPQRRLKKGLKFTRCLHGVGIRGRALTVITSNSPFLAFDFDSIKMIIHHFYNKFSVHRYCLHHFVSDFAIRALKRRVYFNDKWLFFMLFFYSFIAK